MLQHDEERLGTSRRYHDQAWIELRHHCAFDKGPENSVPLLSQNLAADEKAEEPTTLNNTVGSATKSRSGIGAPSASGCGISVKVMAFLVMFCLAASSLVRRGTFLLVKSKITGEIFAEQQLLFFFDVDSTTESAVLSFDR